MPRTMFSETPCSLLYLEFISRIGVLVDFRQTEKVASYIKPWKVYNSQGWNWRADRIIEEAIAEYETVQCIQYLSKIQVNDHMFEMVKVDMGIIRYDINPDLIDNSGLKAVGFSQNTNMLADVVWGQSDATSFSSAAQSGLNFYAKSWKI